METNGNKSKLLRASLQACFACNCSNLRKHSLFLLFSSSLCQSDNDDHNKDDNVVHVFPSNFFWGFLFSPNTCLVCLFIYLHIHCIP